VNTSLAHLLTELVSIPSVNPALGGSGEAALGTFVAEFLRRTGADVWVQPVAGERANVVAALRGPPGPALLLEAHLDTVAPGAGWQRDPFAPTEKDGRLYGLGACDTKGSLATFLTVFAEFAREPRRLAQPLVFAATVDEEVEQQGAYALMRQDLKLGAAVIGEPTQCEVVAAHKGFVRCALRTSGRSAHSSVPETGSNAIMRMVPVLQSLQVYAAALARRSPHPLLGFPTVNIGTIRGGTGVNSVPDGCEIRLDRRTVPGEDAETVVAELRALLPAEADGQIDDVVIRPPLATPVEAPVVESLLRALRATGSPATVTGKPYLTNAVACAAAGVPAVVFGPGDLAQAHRPDEYVTLEQLRRAQASLRYWVEHGLSAASQ
jgi:acetylornithine deacetylase